MDQIAALQWVRRNAEAFGGDPDNITLFGESAGGQDVLVLLSIPSARGLFARAIAESPGRSWSPLSSLPEAETAGERLAARAGLPAGATLAQLRALPAGKLLGTGEDSGPVIDGRLLTETPAQAFARGHAADLPLILGSNSYEASLLSPSQRPARLPDPLRTAYAAESADGQGLAAALFTDAFFAAPMRWFARQAAPGAPAWLYHFSYVRPSQRGKVPGAPHGSEIPYVFDSWDKISSAAALLPAEARTVTARIHSCWVAFARTGVPACQGAPSWPAYTPDRDELMDFGATPTVRQHFRQPQLDAQESARHTP